MFSVLLNTYSDLLTKPRAKKIFDYTIKNVNNIEDKLGVFKVYFSNLMIDVNGEVHLYSDCETCKDLACFIGPFLFIDVFMNLKQLEQCPSEQAKESMEFLKTLRKRFSSLVFQYFQEFMALNAKTSIKKLGALLDAVNIAYSKKKPCLTSENSVADENIKFVRRVRLHYKFISEKNKIDCQEDSLNEIKSLTIGDGY